MTVLVDGIDEETDVTVHLIRASGNRAFIRIDTSQDLFKLLAVSLWKCGAEAFHAYRHTPGGGGSSDEIESTALSAVDTDVREALGLRSIQHSAPLSCNHSAAVSQMSSDFSSCTLTSGPASVIASLVRRIES